MLSFDASSPSVCGACSIWLITACWSWATTREPVDILRDGITAEIADAAQPGGDLAGQDVAELLEKLHALTLAERLALAMLTDGRYRKNLERLKTRLAHAQDATLAMFTELGWPLFTAPAGGLFVWASPGDSGPDPLRLAEWARAADILLAPGCLFRPDRADTPWLRFNVAFSHGETLLRFLRGAK